MLTTVIIVLISCDSSPSSLDLTENKKPIRIACVGDSITARSGLDNPNKDSYPSQLANILGEGFEVVNFGVNDATVLKASSKPYWNTSQFVSSHTFNPNIVVIMLGTNDAKPRNCMICQPYFRQITRHSTQPFQIVTF